MEAIDGEVCISVRNQDKHEAGMELAKKMREFLKLPHDFECGAFKRNCHSYFFWGVKVPTKQLGVALGDAIEAGRGICESTKNSAKAGLNVLMFAGVCPEVKKEATQAAVCGVLQDYGLPMEVAGLAANLAVTEENYKEFSKAADVNRFSRSLFRGQITGQHAPPSRIPVATDPNNPPQSPL